MKTAIAINIGHKFVAVEAEIIEILGITVGIHKTVGKSGWTVTEIETGVALAKSSGSRVEVIALANVRIATATPDKVRGLLTKQPKAPAVDTLEAHVVKVKVKTTLSDIASILDAIHNTVPLTDRERTAVYRALNSRTGQLKAKAPSAFGDADERLAAAAWHGLQPNAFKVGVVSVLALRGESQDLFNRLSKVRWPAALDKDKAALLALGAW
jgi:hypothetical protein